MPELPEVENMRMLLLNCCNIKINNVIVKNANFRIKVNDSFMLDIKESQINKIKRIGKFLIFILANNKCIVMHAGMSGKFLVNNNSTLAKHDHIVFYLANSLIIKYNDPRRFGLAVTFESEELALSSRLFNNIAIDAMDVNFNSEYLSDKIKHLKAPIKTTLLDQKIVAGIGNIYASEILYYAKVHPLRACSSLTSNEIIEVVKYTKEVLIKSIELGGSTLKDYALPNGETGYFQNNFAVYNQQNKPCITCKNPISKTVMAGRATYFCNLEQK